MVGLTVSSSVGLATRFKIDGDRDEAMRHQLGLTEEDEDTKSVSIDAEDRKDIIYVHRDVENSERFGPRINEILRSERDVWDAILFLPSPTQRLRRILQKENDLTHVHLDTRDDHTDNIINVARKAVTDTSTSLVLTHVDVPQILKLEEESSTPAAQIIFPLKPSAQTEMTTVPNSLEYGASYAFLRFLKSARTVDFTFSDKIFLRDLQVSYPDKQVSESLNNIALELLRHNLVRLLPKPQSHWDDNVEQKTYITIESSDLTQAFTSLTMQKRFRLTLNVSNLHLDYATNPSLLQYDKSLDERYLELDEKEIKRQREHFNSEVRRIMPILEEYEEEKRIVGLLELERYERELIGREDELERRRIGIKEHYAASLLSQSKLF